MTDKPNTLRHPLALGGHTSEEVEILIASRAFEIKQTDIHTLTFTFESGAKSCQLKEISSIIYGGRPLLDNWSFPFFPDLSNVDRFVGLIEIKQSSYLDHIRDNRFCGTLHTKHRLFSYQDNEEDVYWLVTAAHMVATPT
jgi:hypothetical protein